MNPTDSHTRSPRHHKRQRHACAHGHHHGFVQRHLLYGLALLENNQADQAKAVFEKIAVDYPNPAGQEPTAATPAITSRPGPSPASLITALWNTFPWVLLPR